MKWLQPSNMYHAPRPAVTMRARTTDDTPCPLGKPLRLLPQQEEGEEFEEGEEAEEEEEEPPQPPPQQQQQYEAPMAIAEEEEVSCLRAACLLLGTKR